MKTVTKHIFLSTMHYQVISSYGIDFAESTILFCREADFTFWHLSVEKG